MRRLKPDVQLHMAALENGADSDRKFALAWATAAQTFATTLNRGDTVKAATARAMRALRPPDSLKPRDCCGLVVEVRLSKDGNGVTP